MQHVYKKCDKIFIMKDQSRDTDDPVVIFFSIYLLKYHTIQPNLHGKIPSGNHATHKMIDKLI